MQEFVAAYNLLIHLVRLSPLLPNVLPRICQNLSKPVTSSPNHSSGLILSILTTIFNIIPKSSDIRYHVFLEILRAVKNSASISSSFETLEPQLASLHTWFQEWTIDEEEQRNLLLLVAEVASDAGDAEQSYTYLLRALRTIPSSEVSSDEARGLSIRAVRSALSNPSQFDFQDLLSLDSIQALAKSDAIYFEVLEIFSSEQLDDYLDFLETNPDFLEEAKLPASVLDRKMRLLTLTSLASSTSSRSVPYEHIKRALQIPTEDVEMWVIDVIRAGLVEGKLSQLDKVFLVHRSTYRVFGEKQWTEVQSRLDTWRASLENVLGVIRGEKEKMAREKAEEEEAARQPRINGYGGRGGGYVGRRQQQQQREMDVGYD